MIRSILWIALIVSSVMMVSMGVMAVTDNRLKRCLNAGAVVMGPMCIKVEALK